jgi:transcriptional regulator GlxA family with amidase domain
MIKRPLIYSLAFIVPPLIVGTLLAFKTLARVMIISQPNPVTIETTSPLKTLPANKPRVAIIASPSGTQVTSLMAAYGVLSASGEFGVYTVAPERTFLPVTGGLAILPDFSFGNAPAPDLIVVPAVLDPSNKRIIDWLKENAPKAKMILSLCEGARVLANAGLLKGKQATSHFLAISDLKRVEPDANWKQGPRFVSDGNITTSAGVMASYEAVLFAIEKFAGKKVSDSVSKDLGLPIFETKAVQDSVHPSDLFILGLKSAFTLSRQTLEVLVYPGVNEISLAALLDTLPRTLTLETFTVARKRRIIASQYGMMLIPQHAIEDLPPADMLLVPAGENVSEFKNTHEWVQKENIPVKSFFHDVPGSTYDRALDLVFQLTQNEDPATAGQISGFIAKVMNFPRTVIKDVKESQLLALTRSRLLIYPLIIGLISVLITWMIDRRISAKLQA